MSKAKILFFGKLPPPFNGENIITKSILDLLEQHYEVTIINKSEKEEAGNGFLGRLKFLFVQGSNLISLFLKVHNCVRNEKFDFLYFCGSPSVSGHFSDIILVKITRKYVDKIICHLHNRQFESKFISSPTKKSAAYLANNVDKFVFLSANLSDELKDHIPADKRTYLFNHINKELVVTEGEYQHKKTIKAKEDKYVITYLSNFILTKGYMELVGAIELLPAELKSKLKVRFIGKWIDGPKEEKAFFDKVAEPELAEIIEYIGPVYDKARIKQYLLESDIFCLPTYYPIEAQPISIIEAMNAGDAIISTLHASIPEFVENGKDGYLVPVRDVDALAQAIIKTCTRQALSSFSDNVRAKYQAEFNDDAILNGLLKIFS